MKRRELALDLSKELNISRSEAEELLKKVVLVMGRNLVNGQSICLSTFGTLRPVRRSRRSYGPQAHPSSAKPDTVQVEFRAADKLLEAIRDGDDKVTFQKRPNRLPVTS